MAMYIATVDVIWMENRDPCVFGLVRLNTKKIILISILEFKVVLKKQ